MVTRDETDIYIDVSKMRCQKLVELLGSCLQRKRQAVGGGNSSAQVNAVTKSQPCRHRNRWLNCLRLPQI